MQTEIVKAAAELFSVHGLQAISVPRLMAEVGQTHGGFYRRFRSKDVLAAEACRALFTQILQRIREKRASRHNALSLQREIPEFRALALLATDAARSEAGSEFKGVYLNGMRRVVAAIDDSHNDSAKDGEQILAATLGAFILQEACKPRDS